MIRRPPRSPLFPSTPLFRSVPIVAERDGHAFIPAALEAGAPAYLTAQEPVGGTAIRVRDTGAALLRLRAFARRRGGGAIGLTRSGEHTSELQSQANLGCRPL